MSSRVGKKFVLLPPEVYESLLQKSSKVKDILAPPEKAALNEAENNMKNVWHRDDIPEDEKVKDYIKELNSLKRYRNFMLKPEEDNIKLEKDKNVIPSSYKETAKEKNSLDENQAGRVEDILNVIPKTLRKDAGQILRFINSNPEKLTWNADKELVYQGSVLHGSNVGDLLMDTLSNRKKMISPTLFRYTFSKGLDEISLPKEWIKNTKMKDLMEYQNKENSDLSRKRSKSTPYPVKFNSKIVTPKSPTKWLSSTSRIR